jgi:Flp pilus assembly pilin Flp
VKPLLLRLYRDEAGQSMTEYILLIVLVAVGCMLAYKRYGQALQNRFIGSGNKLYGATDNCGH